MCPLSLSVHLSVSVRLSLTLSVCLSLCLSLPTCTGALPPQANDNIAQRLNQKLQAAEETLKQVQDKLQSVIKLSPHDQEQDLMRLADNPYCFLPDDVDLFLAQFKKLLVVQLKYEDLMEERNYVLTHLGLPPGERPDEDAEQASLLKAYMDFASRNDERIERLQKVCVCV